MAAAHQVQRTIRSSWLKPVLPPEGLSYTQLCSTSATARKIMAPLPEGFSYAQWSAVYNALSFGIAGMGSATIFFWLQLANINRKYRTALIITGIVTFIATYHYFRIFNSWVEAFEVSNIGGGDYTVKLTGTPFNDAYRYVDWLLTVPLLMIELIFVVGAQLGCAAALISSARLLIAVSWLTYPFVYMDKFFGLAGTTATMFEQIGYSVADFVAKAIFGVLICRIAAEKSKSVAKA